MKELSIEQKVKRYDEAIEKFDVILNLNTVKESGTIFADDVRKIFPELKESEDERIRKELICFLETEIPQCNARDKYITWLEKQGEANPYSGTSFEYNGHTWGMCARDGGVDILLDKQLFKHLEKQGEQKSTDNYEKNCRS